MLKERTGEELKQCERRQRERPVSLNGRWPYTQTGIYPICKSVQANNIRMTYAI